MLCNDILETETRKSQWTASVMIQIPKKKLSKKCSDRTRISVTSYSSKVLLKIILNKVTSKAEEIPAESQAGFRKDLSTVEQILKLWTICEES